MEVKPGYKQTEVGVIPEDWEVCRSSIDTAATWFTRLRRQRTFTSTAVRLFTGIQLSSR